MKCPSCGTWYPEQKIFCIACGELLSGSDGQVRMGEYTLLNKIGQGGVGVVYKARHNDFDFEVAIKILNQETFGDIKGFQRFQREARMHAQLKHPNIIDFIEIYEEGEFLALVMELLSGCDLKEYILHQGALQIGEVIRISVPVLSALEKMHELGMTHRDLKPSNIFITDEGSPKVMDFGLAKTSFKNEDITDSGMTVGTYLYMAPEQILAKAVGPYTDLYAFGIILYRMCTTVLPFVSTGGGEFEVMEKQVRLTPQNPQELNPEIPDDLAKLIMHLLEKSPNKRPQSCLDIIQRIKALGEETNLSLAEKKDVQQEVSTFSDLNTGIGQASVKPDENTADLHSLKGVFSIESTQASEKVLVQMRKPLKLEKERLQHLRDAIAGIQPLPKVWDEIQAVFDDVQSSPADLAKVLGKDKALAQYVLDMCNSVGYLPEGAAPMSDVAIAMTRIGMDSAQCLIMSAVFSSFLSQEKRALEVKRIWFHGQAIAQFSRTLSESAHVIDRRSASMFGLLHDIGKLVILHIESDEKLTSLKQLITAGKDTVLAEFEVLGYTHIDAGMMLALHWKLPRKLHRFIYYHHAPCWQRPEGWAPDMQAPIMLVHMAHLALSSLLKEENHDGIWDASFRTHVEASASILETPLKLPMQDVSMYSQLRMQFERLKLLFPELYVKK